MNVVSESTGLARQQEAGGSQDARTHFIWPKPRLSENNGRRRGQSEEQAENNAPLLFSGAPIARDIYSFREAAREIWAVAGNKRAHYHRRRRAHFAVPQDTRRTFKMVSIIVRHSSRYPR